MFAWQYLSVFACVLSCNMCFMYSLKTYYLIQQRRRSQEEGIAKIKCSSKWRSICNSAGISQVHMRRRSPHSVTISRLVFQKCLQLSRHPSAAFSPTERANRGKHLPTPHHHFFPSSLFLVSLFHVFCPVSPCVWSHSQTHCLITAGIWSDSSDKAEGPRGPDGDSKRTGKG